ncbi:mitochondrial import receptor subunit TOM40 homolog [Manduca sexta]|uniref:Uncharacterized protein n=1 Tax=Manduca sexta TaxID=7130 RepID=A0A922CSU4_MANSE|nr:mitochondrial import receptor subunit TOM40 homolog [Manduca sexta]KAG6458225.1 hypothetical protein O3G_MSEX010750 [Manduca sexta]
MDINEEMIKQEVNSFVSNIQRLLPKKKDIIVFAPMNSRLTRLRDIHAEAKKVFPSCFIGAKLVVTRELLDKVKLIQQYNYGIPKNKHKCLAQLIDQELEPKDVEDGMIIDSAGCATATYTDKIDRDYIIRLQSKIKDLVSSETEVFIERQLAKSVGMVACSVRDVDPRTLRVVTQWMYKLRPDFYLGTEVVFKPLSYMSTLEYSISARYEKPRFAISSTISKSGFQVCLYKQFAADLRIATVVDEDLKGDTTVGVALQKNYGNGGELKMFVNSQRCGGFTYQKDVYFYEPHNEIRVLRLVGSTLIDRQRRLRFGFGFHLDF